MASQDESSLHKATETQPEGRDPAHAVLTGHGWMLDERTLEPGQPARAAGGWSLLTEARPGVRFPAEVRPMLVLSTALPDEAAEVELRVAPEHSATEHREVWELRFRLLASRVPLVQVAVARDGKSLGRRSLRLERQVQLRLPVPEGSAYQADFSWRSPEGEWKRYEVEIPLLAEATRTTADSGARTHLRSILENRYNLVELGRLCFNLGLQLDSLGGGPTIEAKAVALIEYVERHDGGIRRLLEQVRRERPNVSWHEDGP